MILFSDKLGMLWTLALQTQRQFAMNLKPAETTERIQDQTLKTQTENVNQYKIGMKVNTFLVTMKFIVCLTGKSHIK